MLTGHGEQLLVLMRLRGVNCMRRILHGCFQGLRGNLHTDICKEMLSLQFCMRAVHGNLDQGKHCVRKNTSKSRLA